MRREVCAVFLPLVYCVGFAQQRSGCARAPVKFLLLYHVAKDWFSRTQSLIVFAMDFAYFAAGINRCGDVFGHNVADRSLCVRRKRSHGVIGCIDLFQKMGRVLGALIILRAGFVERASIRAVQCCKDVRSVVEKWISYKITNHSVNRCSPCVNPLGSVALIVINATCCNSAAFPRVASAVGSLISVGPCV